MLKTFENHKKTAGDRALVRVSGPIYLTEEKIYFTEQKLRLHPNTCLIEIRV